MARPPKCRRVEQYPGFTYFKPSGIMLADLEEAQLAVEEVEAIRLRDLEGLEHEECAARMSVSRPTFHRILASARQKIADAMINGKAIRIEGGNFQLASNRLECRKCGHRWEGTVCCRRTRCPSCQDSDWHRVD
ncbi:MAG: DUF134 domain-containing protein [Eubacteriales bacterium]